MTKTIYWIEDAKDASVEFEHTLTYSRKKAIKFFKELRKTMPDKKFKLKSLKGGR